MKKEKTFNPGDVLQEIHDAIIKAGEALNALTTAYNDYINGLNEAMAEINISEAEEAGKQEEDLNG